MKPFTVSVACAVTLYLTAGAYAHAGGAEPGFQTIFDGRTLRGWDGDPKHWSVVEGVIRGDSTKNKARGNTFVIWRDGTLKDFELKLKYRIHGGNNSGVQYRSKEVRKWVVSGYQAEVQNLLGKTGFLYHEKGRGWLVDVGDFMEISRDGKKAVVGEVANLDAIKKAPYHVDKDWNEYHFIARGNHVIHYLGGFQTVELIDYHVNEKNPIKARCMEGVLALQIHAGAPMTVDFKDIRIRQLKEGYGEAKRLFNGEDLTGWTCSSPAAKRAWSVQPAENPRTGKRRGAEVRIGGVLRCAGGARGHIAPSVGLGRSYVVRYQKRVPGDTRTGGPAPHKPVLGWSAHEVTVIGPKVGFRVNGAVRRDARPPVTNGKFVLPTERADYRNIVLIPIVGGQAESEFVQMFDGKTLTGWNTTGNWVVEENNTIALKPRPGERGWTRYKDYLTTDRQYGNFVLDLEFKFNAKGNSGVFMRVGDLRDHVRSGFEVQILDTHGKKKVGAHDCGGVIGTAAPSKNMVEPAGQWNRYTITLKDHDLKVVLNGEQIIDLDISKSRLKDRPAKGYISFQDEGKRVWYRNVRINELK